MSTTSTLGIPKLLPVTATFTLPFVLFNTYLQYKCILARIATSTALGRDCSTSTAKDDVARKPVAISGETGDPMISDPLLVATTAHDNFLQNVPLAFIVAGAVELNGGDRKVLAYTLGFFALARVAHTVGLNGGAKALKFRQFGFFGSVSVLLGLSGWTANLVRGYWGL